MKKDLEVLNSNYCEALENNMLLAKNEENSNEIIDRLTKSNNDV